MTGNGDDMTEEQQEAALKRHRDSIKGPLIPADDADVMDIEEAIARIESEHKKDKDNG